MRIHFLQLNPLQIAQRLAAGESLRHERCPVELGAVPAESLDAVVDRTLRVNELIGNLIPRV